MGSFTGGLFGTACDLQTYNAPRKCPGSKSEGKRIVCTLRKGMNRNAKRKTKLCSIVRPITVACIGQGSRARQGHCFDIWNHQ